jgi:cyclomaltodextrinase
MDESVIIYGVIPPLFGEPPLRSVTERLPYLGDLGVNAIWLSPINACPPGDFGYAMIDHFAIRPEYGGDDDLRALVSAAHGLGIRVLMDFVPNHTSDRHPFFMDAEARGAESPYYDWYARDATGSHTWYFDWSNLPNLNFDNPDVRDYMDRAFAHWVEEFDIDGFRVDACWGVQQRRPEYWAHWSRALRRIKPELVLLAEASARDDYWYHNGYDIAYDWTNDLGRWAWEHVFADPAHTAARLDAALAADPRPARVFRFLNNNDTGIRFSTTYGVGTTRAAAALLMTLPGTPCIYTGEEVGAEYEPYRRPGPIDWDADPLSLQPWYSGLCHLRLQHPSLRSPHWTRVALEPVRGDIYAYLRHGAEGDDPLLVILNFGAGEVDVTCLVPAGFEEVAQAPSLHDVLNVAELPGHRAAIPMPAGSARVLAPSHEEVAA